jgi:hypothetical protein
MSLHALRGLVRPALLIMIIIMIAPLTIATGMLEAFLPGVGVRFANGCLTYLRGVPEAFWIFAGGLSLGHQVTRSVDKRSEAQAISDYADAITTPPNKDD